MKTGQNYRKEEKRRESRKREISKRDERRESEADKEEERKRKTPCQLDWWERKKERIDFFPIDIPRFFFSTSVQSMTK